MVKLTMVTPLQYIKFYRFVKKLLGHYTRLPWDQCGPIFSRVRVITGMNYTVHITRTFTY